MRTIAVFAAGLVVGSLIVARTHAQGDRPVRINHIMVRVDNFDEAVKFYTETMGFKEAFALKNQNGGAGITYLQAGRDTFLELQPASAERKAGIEHIGIQVADIKAYVARLKQRGVEVEEPHTSRAKSLLANMVGPGGARIELVELLPDSLTTIASESWK
jgi:catechol 2,3-dioxygenase-like lactoylglutathione lyase family enzyme